MNRTQLNGMEAEIAEGWKSGGEAFWIGVAQFGEAI